MQLDINDNIEITDEELKSVAKELLNQGVPVWICKLFEQQSLKDKALRTCLSVLEGTDALKAITSDLCSAIAIGYVIGYRHAPSPTSKEI